MRSTASEPYRQSSSSKKKQKTKNQTKKKTKEQQQRERNMIRIVAYRLKNACDDRISSQWLHISCSVEERRDWMDSCLLSKKQYYRRNMVTLKAAGFCIISRSGSHTVTWSMHCSTVTVWITSSAIFCSVAERPGAARVLGIPEGPRVLFKRWIANGRAYDSQEKRTIKI